MSRVESALLKISVSDARLGAAICWNALTVAPSAAIGPAIGALIISIADWHWLYVVNIPLGFGVMQTVDAFARHIRQPTGSHDAYSSLILMRCGKNSTTRAMAETGARNWPHWPRVVISVRVFLKILRS